MSEVEQAVGLRYDPALIEAAWQAYWEEHQTFRAVRRPGKPKYYALDMFPYPSGDGLHVGHPEGYTATDIVARYKRMKGFDVLHPMGWDAFGLPAEQHAIKTGTHPREKTQENIAKFTRQLKMLGLSYDWDREIDTTDPNYVRWTQWIFLQLFKRNLAFQSEVAVNWCPALGTVLANEEVVDGKSEVGGHSVTRMPLRQWMLRITQYADRLDADLAGLDWPDTKAKQHHWIGRSEGANVVFSIEDHAGKTITVFTTRVDTLPGATYVVLAPEHALIQEITSDSERARVSAYVEQARNKSDLDRAEAKTKTGVFTGAYAINPINDGKVPIWIADYVIGTYGTGAIMAVPAHDERDHEFARAFGLPILQVVAPADGRKVDVQTEAYTVDTDDGVAFQLTSKANVENGTPAPEVRRKFTAWLQERKLGEAKVTYRLRDWVFSRQRYWGEPIPIYFPVECDGDPRLSGATFSVRYDTPIAVDESELPLRLPDLDDFKPGEDPAGPLARAKHWRFFQKEGRWYARETNTMPQWAGSCWYYLRYIDPCNDQAAWSQEAYDAWMPVDLYVGGSEHAVLHLLYARFWHKALFDLGFVKHDEPFRKLVHQGMILGENGEKMSKSRGNVVSPDDVVKSHGADALRLYEMFMGPLEQVKPWQTSGIEGVRRFLERVWNLVVQPYCDDMDHETNRLLHKTIQKVTNDIEGMRFNTAVSQMMIFTRHLGSLPAVPRPALRILALLLSPFAPHLGEEIWNKLGGNESLAYEPWPAFDADLVKDDVIEIGVQINGKVRSTVTLAVDATEEIAREAALADPKVQQYTQGKTIKKLIYVRGRIVNLVLSEAKDPL